MKPYDTTRSFVVARGKAALQATGLGAAVGHVLWPVASQAFAAS
ncbi:hypothetical protein [Sinorhizobium meliloti]|nr:hypothetical protein [Sinorhizobium meliloti]